MHFNETSSIGKIGKMVKNEILATTRMLSFARAVLRHLSIYFYFDGMGENPCAEDHI